MIVDCADGIGRMRETESLPLGIVVDCIATYLQTHTAMKNEMDVTLTLLRLHQRFSVRWYCTYRQTRPGKWCSTYCTVNSVSTRGTDYLFL